MTDGARAASSGITSSTLPAPAGAAKPSAIGRLIEDLPAAGEVVGGNDAGNALIPFQEKSKQMLKFAAATDKTAPTSAQVIRRMPSKWPKPEWHAPWKLYRVISGHLGCALPPPPLPLPLPSNVLIATCRQQSPRLRIPSTCQPHPCGCVWTQCSTAFAGLLPGVRFEGFTSSWGFITFIATVRVRPLLPARVYV